MRKALLFAALLIVVAIFVAAFSFNSIVEKGVERYGSLATGSDVSMENADISLFSGKGSMKGLVIDNPEGFRTEHAFSIDEARVDVNVRSIFSDNLKIYEIYIDSPVVTYERGRNTDNIQKILGNVKKFSGGTAGEGVKTESDTLSKREKKVEIDRFIIKNGKINMSASMLKGEGITVELPDMHLRDIGKEGEDAALSRVIEVVFAKVNRAIGDAVAGSAGDIRKSVEEEIKEKTDNTFERLKDVSGE